MNVTDVDTLFQGYCNEDDPTFLDPARRAVYLARGEAQYRNLVRTLDPNFYRTQVTLTLANQDTYDLATAAVRVLGTQAGLTATRLSSVIRVERIDTAGTWLWDYEAAASLAEMRELPNSYLLQGPILYFWARDTGTIRLVYCPVSTVNWTVLDTAEIDDLYEFHDLIALYAYMHYAVTDGASNPQIAELRRDREMALRRHLGFGRNPGAHDHGSIAG